MMSIKEILQLLAAIFGTAIVFCALVALFASFFKFLFMYV